MLELVTGFGTYLLFQKGLEKGFTTIEAPPLKNRSAFPFSIPKPIWVDCLLGVAFSLAILVAGYYMWREEKKAKP